MLSITTLPLGSYQTNCYIVRKDGNRHCLVIDPGEEAVRLCAFLEKQNLTPAAILLTHGHFDHVGAVKYVAADYDCPVYLCANELSLPPTFTAGPLYYTHTYGEGSTLHLAGLTVLVRHTPGHTPGSVCLQIEDALFTGDTLFAGSCGRTDLPGGDSAAIFKSLKRLSKMEDLAVYPGHGEASTLAWEKKTNPYLQFGEETV